MGQTILKLEGKYLVWSSIVDAPISFGLTLDELKALIKEEYGNDGLRDLPGRLERVEEKGTSEYNRESIDDQIYLNRAGPGEVPLHKEEVIEFYVRRQQKPTKQALAEFRKGLPRCGKACKARERDGCCGLCLKCWGTDYVRVPPG